MAIDIRFAEGSDDMGRIRELFVEYQEWLGVDLCFQGFEEELANLPGKYATPRGCLLLAVDGDDIAGCVGLWPLGDDVCEMKRLYVRPPWRRRGLGRRLAEAVIDEGRERGYRCMRLDTLPQLQAAKSLYEILGFTETAAYYDNPIEGVTYMERNL
ncbi:MAG: GNAT family N-acetyltransferase [Rhodospirillaceae bacterium]|jgi:putative acetyltransferase|nr:GNAT family N-acetyltransferase [Rhodospirillaceae bacterium]